MSYSISPTAFQQESWWSNVALAAKSRLAAVQRHSRACSCTCLCMAVTRLKLYQQMLVEVIMMAVVSTWVTMYVLCAAVVGEKVTGRGILAQVGLETGIPIGQQSIFLIAFISFFLFAALFGAPHTYCFSLMFLILTDPLHLQFSFSDNAKYCCAVARILCIVSWTPLVSCTHAFLPIFACIGKHN